MNIVYAFTFLRGLTFIIPVFALYLQDQLNNVFYVSVIMEVMAISTTLFEVPGGWFADKYGRVRALQSSSITMMIAFLMLLGGSFPFLIMYAVLRGLSDSLSSGSDVALLYDNVKAQDVALSESHRAQLSKVISINTSMWPLGAAIGSFLGGYMMLQSFQLPIMLSIIPAFVGFMCTFWMVESAYKGDTHIAAKFGLLKPVLLLVIGSMVYNSLDEVAHMWKSLYFEAQLVPLFLFGSIFMLTFVLSSLGSYVSHFLRHKYTLPLFTSLSVLLLFTSTRVSGVLSALLLTLCSFCYGVQLPKLMEIYNQYFPSSKRATLISVTNLLNRIGFFVGVLVLGYYAELVGIVAVYTLIASVCFMVPVLYAVWITLFEQ